MTVSTLRPPVLALVLSLLAAPAVLPAQQTGSDLEPVTSVEGITEYVLDNGLRVLLFPDPSKPQITVNITYMVGSRHEAYGETGMAHLLEHLLFLGTPDHPDIPQELSERGAFPNGTTWYDRTNYYETFPASSENLEWALDLEADRMVNSFVAQEDLDSEMTVVRNEMEAGENDPRVMLMQRVLSTQYLWHNYGKSTIGARSDVEQVPIERLQAFYRKYYQPDNAVLIVAGQFDEAEALDLIVEKFGSIPRPERTGYDVIYPTYTDEPTQDGERTVTLRRVGDVKVLIQSYHVPPGSHPDFAAVDVLAFVLGDTPSGRLYQALVETDRATSVGAGAFQLKEAGPLLLFANTRPAADLDALWQGVNDVVDEVRTRPVTGDEVARAKQALLSDIRQQFNSSAGIALQLSEWEAMGDWRLLFLHRDRIEAVTADDVNRVAQAYLKPSNRTVGLFHPTEDPDRATIPDEPDVEAMVEGYTGREAVAQGEAFDPSPANIDARTETFTLPNGMEVALLPKATRGETVVTTLRLQFGDEESLTGRAGAGSMAGSMLMRGTTERSRQEIQDELDRLQAQGGVGGSAMTGNGQFQTIRQSLPDVIRLMAEIVRQPAFPESEFRVLKEQQLAALEENRSDPQTLGSIALQRHTDPWPAGHPRYTPTLEESIQGLQSMTLDDVRSFYGDFYGPQSGNIVVVGDFDPAEVRSVIEASFGDWQSPHAYARVPTPFRDVAGEDITVQTPDKANAFFFAQQNLELSDTHPDYPALVLAGYMIGGGVLNSRLSKRIRTEEGLSYGVGAGISGHPIDPVGSFGAIAIYAPENREALEAAFFEEIEKVLADGFTAEEVAAAQQGWLESQQLIRAQDPSLAGALSSKLYFDRTFEYDARLEATVRSLTVDEINAAVRRHLDPEKITIVKAGDFQNTERPIG